MPDPILTIGMATCNDYDGCYFTIQAIQLYHPEILSDVEFLIVDNNSSPRCAEALNAFEDSVPNFRYVTHRSRRGTASRDMVFREAAGDFVLCVDSHVYFPAGALARLMDYCRQNPDSIDLLQGPLLGDDCNPMAMCFRPVWSHAMYGVWALDERGDDVDAPPFEIPMQGLGAFACRREAWPGFNPRLAGFGGEEGYIHEKIRSAGGRNLCLPFLRWMHRFERPMGIRFSAGYEDRIRNYLLIHKELGLDPKPVIDHFTEFIGETETRRLVQATQTEIEGPFHFFDAIYCIGLEAAAARRQAMVQRFRALSIDRGIRWFPAADTPGDRRIGHVLSHRRIVEEARLQKLENVLVIGADVVFTANAVQALTETLKELEGREWRMLWLASSTQAVAYHHTVYDTILESLPDKAAGVAEWLREYPSLEDFCITTLRTSSVQVVPPATVSSN